MAAEDKSLKRQKKHVTSLTLKAVREFSLIEEGDRVLIALSGGKDSSLLTEILRDFTRWFEPPFHLEAVNVKTDLTCGGCARESLIREFAASRQVPLEVLRITIRDKLEPGQEPDCFICAWNRRKAIFNYAAERGFTKIAFGHHLDDVVETALLNLFFTGEFAPMFPKQEMFGGKIYIIRPFLYVPEKKILSLVNKLGIRHSACRCPYGEKSRRKWVKNLVASLEKENRHVKRNIFRHALKIIRQGGTGFAPKRRKNRLALTVPGDAF
ncbi:MAG: tRNA 2-thiocytidine biosynthesis protein TtcA [Deltaproteobacteria bacterium]|nr:MAG: tRNA 2-thiocytidine biosynthesis protein TtcA [Deltaproteobacteria bacterium]